MKSSTLIYLSYSQGGSPADRTLALEATESPNPMHNSVKHHIGNMQVAQTNRCRNRNQPS